VTSILIYALSALMRRAEARTPPTGTATMAWLGHRFMFVILEGRAGIRSAIRVSCPCGRPIIGVENKIQYLGAIIALTLIA
jgi:hypothetical protein